MATGQRFLVFIMAALIIKTMDAHTTSEFQGSMDKLGRRGASADGGYTWAADANAAANRAGNDEEDDHDVGDSLHAPGPSYALIAALAKYPPAKRKEVSAKASARLEGSTFPKRVLDQALELGEGDVQNTGGATSTPHRRRSSDRRRRTKVDKARRRCTRVARRRASTSRRRGSTSRRRVGPSSKQICESKPNQWYYYTRRRSPPTCKVATPFDAGKAAEFARAINTAWANEHGLCGCEEKVPDPTKRRSAAERDKFLLKVAGRTEASLKSTKMHIPKSLSNQWLHNYVVMHRSGVHEIQYASLQDSYSYLCATWTAVCSALPPYRGQRCATARTVLGCARSWGDGTWVDCNTWSSLAKITDPNFA